VNALRWARTQWDRVSAWCFIGVGAIAIVVGWNGVSSEALTAQQVPYIVSGGIGGLFLLGVGTMLWLSADLRDEWRKLDAIERNTRPSVEGEVEADEADDDPFAGPASTNGGEPDPEDGSPTKPIKAKRTGRAKPLIVR
jgi:hypothetical protein